MNYILNSTINTDFRPKKNADLFELLHFLKGSKKKKTSISKYFVNLKLLERNGII